MNRRNFIIGAGGAAATVAVGSLAYTSATVEREVDVTVVADDDADAAIQLVSGVGTTQTEDGQLLVHGESDGNDGSNKFLTPDGEFTFGSHDSPETTNAFTMANQLAEDRDFGFDVNNIVPAGANLVFTFYDDTGEEIGVVDGEGSETVTLTAGEVSYVVLEIHTDVDDTDLTGEVTITAEETAA